MHFTQMAITIGERDRQPVLPWNIRSEILSCIAVPDTLYVVTTTTQNDHFVAALRQQYGNLEAEDRKQKIRELVAESDEIKEFIQKEFPEFFAEAFPSRSSSAGSRSVLNAQTALCAKPR